MEDGSGAGADGAVPGPGRGAEPGPGVPGQRRRHDVERPVPADHQPDGRARCRLRRRGGAEQPPRNPAMVLCRQCHDRPAPGRRRHLRARLRHVQQHQPHAGYTASDGARLREVSPGPGDGWLAYDGTTVCAVSGVSPDAQPPPDAGPEPTQMWTSRQRRPAAVPVTSQRWLLLTAGHDRGHGLRADGRERAHPPGLHAVNPGTGRTAWSYLGASAAPAAARGRVCTASPAGDLITLNASDGAPAWQCPIRVTLGTRPRRPHRPCLRQHHGLRRPGLSQ